MQVGALRELPPGTPSAELLQKEHELSCASGGGLVKAVLI